MDIGIKIKEARTSSELTQEQVAEALGVSRQTVSNWETGKSYPDIISVIKMSDLYSVSLDYLMKGEDSMSDYMDYLEESTNVVKSKKRLSKIIQATAYLAVWVLLAVLFWIFMLFDGAGMIWELAYLIVLPLTTFIVSFLIGSDSGWRISKWLMPLFFSGMFMLYNVATIGLANRIADWRMGMPDIPILIVVALISLIGVGLGFGSSFISITVKRTKKAGTHTSDDIKRREKRKKIIQVCVYFGLWLIMLAVYWIMWLVQRQEEYVPGVSSTQPFFAVRIAIIASFVAAIIVGIDKGWKRFKWFTPLIFGAAIMLSDYLTRDVRIMVEDYGKNYFNYRFPDIWLMLSGGLLCLFGVAIGYISNLKRVINDIGDKINKPVDKVDKLDKLDKEKES